MSQKSLTLLPFKNHPLDSHSIENVSVVICRGLPGSGKSTFANNWHCNAIVCSADDYFVNSEGEYIFNPSKLKDAHEACFQKFLQALDSGTFTVFVDNTNTEEWQMLPYIKEVLSRIESGKKINLYIADFVCTVQESFNWNTHNVPMHTIERMQKNLEASRNLEANYWNVSNGKIIYHKYPKEMFQ